MTGESYLTLPPGSSRDAMWAQGTVGAPQRAVREGFVGRQLQILPVYFIHGFLRPVLSLVPTAASDSLPSWTTATTFPCPIHAPSLSSPSHLLPKRSHPPSLMGLIVISKPTTPTFSSPAPSSSLKSRLLPSQYFKHLES